MPTRQGPIVVVGSINMDLVAHAPHIPSTGETVLGTEFQTHPGGKGANQAVAAARLGHPVAIVGCVGQDAFGLQLRQSLQEAGVNVDAVTSVPGSSGIAVIVVAQGGENSIVITPGANSELTPAQLDRHREVIRSAGLVLTQLEIPLDTVEHLVALCSQEGVPLILDPAPARELPASILQGIAWLTPNESEADILLGKHNSLSKEPKETAAALHSQGARAVVLKRGERGVYVSPQSADAFSVKTFPVQAVDTTAAGDAFNGAFAVALMLGKSDNESATFASAAAALSVTRSGAQPSMPNRAETMALLAEQVPAPIPITKDQAKTMS